MRNGSNIPIIPKSENVDLYVLAGDIGNPYEVQTRIHSVKELEEQKIAYLAGNHEYYHQDFDDVNNFVFNNLNSSYNNHTIDVKGRKVHMCTLWTHMSSPIREIMYEKQLNDSNYIGDWSGERANEEFKKSYEWLMDVVEEGDLVFTHHSPSNMSVVDRWKGNPINDFFHNNLDNFIKTRKPALWGHGHIHDPVDYMLGDTRVVANPHGYPEERYLLDKKYGKYEPLIIEL